MCTHTQEPFVHFLVELGANRVAHTRRTLLDHLVGTAAILERWGASSDVCIAGLFHSIYGTEYFKTAVVGLADRPKLEALVGTAAERLAHTFCVFDRSSVYRAIDRGAPYELERLDRSGRISVTRAELAGIVQILWANALEQAEHVPPTAEERARSRRDWARCAALLSPAACSELAARYGAAATRAPGLAALFDIADPTEFLSSMFPSRTYLARGRVERLDGLVSFDLDALVAMKKRFTKAFYRGTGGEAGSLVVQRGQELDLYTAGFTLYFHSVSCPEIDGWVRALDADLGLLPGVTRVSAFASRRGLGLKPHYDMNDNFVCQARGLKRWRMAPNTHVVNPSVGYTVGATPTAEQEAEAPNGFPSELPTPFETIDMVPGSVLFIPRGWWHDTETLESESLHFNIQSGFATWKDVLEFVFLGTTALHAEPLRTAIRELSTGKVAAPAFEAELKTKIRELADAICSDEITLDMAALQRHVASRRSV